MGFGMGFCCCGCKGCKGTLPESLTVVLAGATDPNCQGWHVNGTFVLPYLRCVTYIPFGDLLNDSQYVGDFTVGTAAGCVPFLDLSISAEIVFKASTGERVVHVEVRNTHPNPPFCPAYTLIFDLTTSSETEAYNCTTFSSLNIPLVSDTCGDPVTCHLSS